MKETTKEGIALRFTLFLSIPGIITFEEYSPLYFKQLGFTSSDVGLTSLAGIIVPSLAVTSIGIFADRFRRRKLVLFLCLLVSVPIILAPLLPMVTLDKVCNLIDTSSEASHTKTATPSSNESSAWLISNSNVSSRTRTATVDRPPLYSSPLQSTPMLIFESPTFSLGNSSVSFTSKDSTNSNLFPLWFVYVIIVRMVYDVLKRTVDTMLKVSTASYVTRIGGNFGAYHCWIDIGASLSLFAAGMLASRVAYNTCGKEENGYFVTLIVSASTMFLSLGALPWMTFEYLDYRVVNWAEVKSVIFNRHYIVMLTMAYFVGFSHAFSVRWEFWYIAELSGGPVIMAVGGFTRRVFVIFFFLASGIFIRRFGELEMVAVALFSYAVAFLALSFIRVAWLVLVVDVFHAAAFAFSLSSLVIHFAKAASKASSATIQGILDGVQMGLGHESGAAVTGILFEHVGPQTTFRCYALALTLVLAFFLFYISTADLDDNQSISKIDSEEYEESEESFLD